MKRRNLTSPALILLATATWTLAPATADVVDFEDAHLGGSLATSDYSPKDDGNYGSHDFTTKGVTFASSNGFDSPFYYWNDWAFSNRTDNTTRGYLNQYSAYPGSGADGSATYGLLYGDAGGAESGEITIAAGQHVQQVQIATTTYSYFDMLEGSSYSDFLEAGDWLNVTIRGYDASDNLVGSEVVYLADYRSGVLEIIDDWEPVDLTSLADARRLTFTFDENPENKDDLSIYGLGILMTHPAYLAIDNLVLTSDQVAGVPEPASWILAALGACLLLGRRRRGVR